MGWISPDRMDKSAYFRELRSLAFFNCVFAVVYPTITGYFQPSGDVIKIFTPLLCSFGWFLTAAINPRLRDIGVGAMTRWSGIVIAVAAYLYFLADESKYDPEHSIYMTTYFAKFCVSWAVILLVSVFIGLVKGSQGRSKYGWPQQE